MKHAKVGEVSRAAVVREASKVVAGSLTEVNRAANKVVSAKVAAEASKVAAEAKVVSAKVAAEANKASGRILGWSMVRREILRHGSV